MQLWTGKYCEPDVLFMDYQHSDRRHKTYWQGADLVMEVVSPNNPAHDREQKHFEYAKAGIPEYWLVDPIINHIRVYNLEGEAYSLHGEFTIGQKVTSKLLEGFTIEVDDVFSY